MKTVDIMEMVTNAIDKTILRDWKHEGFIGGFTSEHINFEIDGREYVLRISEVKEGKHWSEIPETDSTTNRIESAPTLQDVLGGLGYVDH